MPTYTQPAGDYTSKNAISYFQDVAVSPATVKDGSLKQRLATHLYPKTGVTVVENRGLPAVSVVASTLTPVHAVAFTLTATVTSVTKKPLTGLVTFKDGATTLGTATVSGNGTGTATLNVAGGVAAGVHTITAVYGGKTSTPITVTAS